MKHNQTLNQMNINPHAMGLFTSKAITRYMSGLGQKDTKYIKGGGRMGVPSEETKQASEPNLGV